MSIPQKNCITTAIVSRGDLRSCHRSFPEEYWGQRIIAQGYRILIAGAPKVGKSDFFLEMGLRAASGGTFLGKRFLRPLKVIYLQSEIHEAYLNERIQIFESACDKDSKNLIAKNFHISGRLSIDLMLESDWNGLQKILLALQPDIVGIDPVISFSSTDENSSKEVSCLLYKRIVNLQTSISSNPAIVLIHHLKKPQENRDNLASFFNIRGSGAWQGWYDTGIMLSKKEQSVILNFDTRHQRTPCQQWVKLNREKGCWEHITVNAHDFSQKVNLAVQFVNESNEGVTSPNLRDVLMDRLGIARRTAYKIIEKLRAHPEIVANPTGGQNYLFLSNKIQKREKHDAGL